MRIQHLFKLFWSLQKHNKKTTPTEIVTDTFFERLASGMLLRKAAFHEFMWKH